ncbi:MAG: hypothetical protein ACXW19_04130 [Thermoanaerobaculia bacterium]
MKRLLVVVTVIVVAAAAGRTARSEVRRATPLAIRALSDDPGVAGAAIGRLRNRGQRGVDLMIAGAPSNPAAQARFRDALDRVCRQRDCYASRLYWYTDLEQAKQVAKTSGKPILSLHLLGNLDEDLSCANSRFFRTTLYSDPKISQYMRDHFILHWQSVRPAPKVTVDFGDGRRLLRTITGNSIHYMLDNEGRPLEALPGLYSPDAFLRQLEKMNGLARSYTAAEPHLKQTTLQVYHAAESAEVADRFGMDIQRLRRPEEASSIFPTARRAARLTMTKTISEAPLLDSFDLRREPLTDPEWKKIAAKYGEKVHFAPESVALIRQKISNPAALEDMLRNLETSVAEDTVRNEYDLHRRIHGWLMSEPSITLSALDERVYEQLFLTPSRDPWLGLLQADVFSAVKNDGVEIAGR